MSLFVINRYLGEDNNPSVSETDHLLALQKKIEERKREKELATSGISAQSNKTEQVPRKKKHKKRKNKTESEVLDSTSTKEENGDLNSINDINTCENLSDELVRKKKKAKKEYKTNEDSFMEVDEKEDITQELDSLQINGFSGNDETEKQSRKKKKKRSRDEINDDSKVEENDTESHQLGVMENEAEFTKKQKNKSINKSELEEINKNFTILKAGKQTKGGIVKRVLPDWLANPEIVSPNLSSGPSLEEVIATGQLDSKIIENLRNQGFTNLFPVQIKLLSWLLKCNESRKKGLWSRDTCVSAPTGSGKTLAYVLPIVEILKTRFIRKIRCLIVLPVQELAMQVYKIVEKYVNNVSFEHTRLKVGLVSGAASFEKEQEALVSKDNKENFTSRIDILVATPRRLIDHIHKTPGFTLNDLQFLVIDEADRETFDWLHELPVPHSKALPLTLNNMLNNSIPAQKLLFSATLSQDPEKLSRLGLFHPILYTTAIVKNRDDDVNLDKEFTNDQKEEGDVGRFTSPNELTIKAIQCAEEHKPLAVYRLLKKVDHENEKSLIFTNSCNAAHRLTLLVKSLFSEKAITISELSGQMNSKKREQEYQKFVRGDIRILICSDVLARGVDIPGIKLVISYDPPKHMRAFIHRAGRTGRAGVPGTAVFLLIPRQVPIFKKLFTAAKRDVPEIKEKDFKSLAAKIDYSSHIENLKDSLEKERKSGSAKRKFVKINNK